MRGVRGRIHSHTTRSASWDIDSISREEIHNARTVAAIKSRKQRDALNQFLVFNNNPTEGITKAKFYGRNEDGVITLADVTATPPIPAEYISRQNAAPFKFFPAQTVGRASVFIDPAETITIRAEAYIAPGGIVTSVAPTTDLDWQVVGRFSSGSISTNNTCEIDLHIRAVMGGDVV